jgi:outer membrane lipoprotein-sorting protein
MKHLTLVLVVALAAGTLAAQSDPGSIVQAMEKKMDPNAKTDMVLVHIDKNGTRDEYRMTSYTKDNNQKIIVRFTAPARMVGADLIMLDRNVWAFDKASGRETKIPTNQSFGGTGFSYGDVLRLNFSDNYVPMVTSEDAKTWTLELTAKERDAPYYRIVLVVGKDFNPLSGTCFTRSGDVVKTITYTEVRDLGSGPKPVTVTVRSPLDEKDVSSLTVTKELVKDYPDNIFNKRNLAARLEEKL